MTNKECQFFRIVVVMIVVCNIGSLAWCHVARQSVIDDVLLEGKWTRDELDILWQTVDGQTWSHWRLTIRQADGDGHHLDDPFIIIR